MAFVDGDIEDNFMVTYELDARDAEAGIEREIEAGWLTTIVTTGSIVLEEARRVLDDAAGWPGTAAVLSSALARVVPLHRELAVDVVRRRLCTIAETHFKDEWNPERGYSRQADAECGPPLYNFLAISTDHPGRYRLLFMRRA